MNSVLESLILKWMESNGSSSNFIEPINPKLDVTEEDIKAYIDGNLKTQFKVLCAQRNISQRIVLYNLIYQWSNEIS